MAVTRRRLIRLMLAIPGPLPTDDAEWAYELKWDGVRAVASLSTGSLQLPCRTDQNRTGCDPVPIRPGDGYADLLPG